MDPLRVANGRFELAGTSAPQEGSQRQQKILSWRDGVPQPVAGELAGKLALVIGGGGGIGCAIAARLAAEGATVAVSYTDDVQAAAETVKAINQAGGEAFALQADVERVPEIEAMFAALDAELAARDRELDIIVTSAAIDPPGLTAEIDEAAFDKVFGTNLKAAFFVTREALKRMSIGGRIIMVSSLAAAQPAPSLAFYSAAKAALGALTTAVALEAGTHGITANAVVLEGT